LWKEKQEEKGSGEMHYNKGVGEEVHRGNQGNLETGRGGEMTDGGRGPATIEACLA